MAHEQIEKINYDTLELTPVSETCLSAQVGPHNVIFVKLLSMDRETVDAWLEMSRQYRETWEISKPVAVVVDTSSLEFAFSPYFFIKGRELMAVRPELTTYIAWIIRDNFVGGLLRGMIGHGAGNSFYHLCYEREKAFAWIEKKCREHQTKQAKQD